MKSKINKDHDKQEKLLRRSISEDKKLDFEEAHELGYEAMHLHT
jgi:hypothetical protein